jgi:hypothetical protein
VANHLGNPLANPSVSPRRLFRGRIDERLHPIAEGPAPEEEKDAAGRSSFPHLPREGSNVMPVHDWTRVSDATFHDFHYSWVLEIKRALMRGLLPKGYYVVAEQFGGDLGAPDVLTLQRAGSNPAAEGPLAGTATLTASWP